MAHVSYMFIEGWKNELIPYFFNFIGKLSDFDWILVYFLAGCFNCVNFAVFSSSLLFFRLNILKPAQCILRPLRVCYCNDEGGKLHLWLEIMP